MSSWPQVTFCSCLFITVRKGVPPKAQGGHLCDEYIPATPAVAQQHYIPCLLPKSWLSAPMPNRNRDSYGEGKCGFITLPGKGEHSRLVPQELCPLPTVRSGVILSVKSDSLWPHGLQHTRPPCPTPSPGAYSNSCPLTRWCHPTISSAVVHFSSCLQSSQHQGLFLWINSLLMWPK